MPGLEATLAARGPLSEPSRSRRAGPGRCRVRTQVASTGIGHRALQLRLAHLRPAADVELACLRLELLPRGLVAALHCRRLLAQGRVGALRQVLERLLLLRSGLSFLDVLARCLALFAGRHTS